jgi:DNA-binding response OmpR family regulator
MRQGRRPRTLLVEDDRAPGRILTWMFEEQGALSVLARSCAAAQTIATAAGFDLALVDADLPDGDGVTPAETLLSGCAKAIVAIRSARHGIGENARHPLAVDSVFVKPVPIPLLLDLLTNVCRNGPDFVTEMRQTRAAAPWPRSSENTPCLNASFSAWG